MSCSGEAEPCRSCWEREAEQDRGNGRSFERSKLFYVKFSFLFQLFFFNGRSFKRTLFIIIAIFSYHHRIYRPNKNLNWQQKSTGKRSTFLIIIAIASKNLVKTFTGDKDQLVPLRLGQRHLCPCRWTIHPYPVQVQFSSYLHQHHHMWIVDPPVSFKVGLHIHSHLSLLRSFILAAIYMNLNSLSMQGQQTDSSKTL